MTGGRRNVVTVTEAGAIFGRVLQAFDPVDGHARVRFGAP